jgi:ElaB/YqjD/DUF883 family membrane-anchored ribosome-binding protein
MTTSNDPDEIRADIERTRATLSNDVDDLAETVKPQSVARRQADKVKEAVSGVKERVMGSDEDEEAIADKALAAKDTVSEKASGTREAVRRAPTTVKRKAQGNPLAAGVIAFGVGMLVSSLIPPTAKEREAVSQLQENLEPVKEKATEVARDMADSVKQSAQEAAESVKAVITEGAGSVRQEGQAAAADVRDQAQASKEAVREQPR